MKRPLVVDQIFSFVLVPIPKKTLGYYFGYIEKLFFFIFLIGLYIVTHLDVCHEFSSSTLILTSDTNSNPFNCVLDNKNKGNKILK